MGFGDVKKAIAKPAPKPPAPPAPPREKHETKTKELAKEMKITILDAWSVVKAHGSGKLKARYRKLIEELES